MYFSFLSVILFTFCMIDHPLCIAQVFSGTGDEKSSNEGTAQRTNRRISYVMATSSPTSKHEASLEATKEDEVKTFQ